MMGEETDEPASHGWFLVHQQEGSGTIRRRDEKGRGDKQEKHSQKILIDIVFKYT